MLKVPVHQVAGHSASKGQLGPLVDESGCFYKPLQNDERGNTEVAFYMSFSSNPRVPKQIQRFFPKFYGTRLVEASDGSGLHPHLVLEDVISNYVKPSIMDVKIGSRTWYAEASEDYIQKCFEKDKKTSSVSLGFRISGLQVYRSAESGYWKADKKQIQKFGADDVSLVLRRFVSSYQPTESDRDLDCAFASSIYGGSAGILAQLRELKSWFEDQTILQFYSCSILMFYDKESLLNGGDPRGAVKLVDFAHVVESKRSIDHNFLGGLCSLIKFISEALATVNECTIEACSTD